VTDPYALLSLICNALIALSAVAGVAVAWWQLSNLVETLRMSGLGVFLELERRINERKAEYDAAVKALQLAHQRTFEELDDVMNIGPATAKQQLDIAVENLLNVIDRLCFCGVRGYIPEQEIKSEYRDYIANLMRTHKEFFGADTQYINIVDLSAKWKRQG
jgi:hypothetical protein